MKTRIIVTLKNDILDPQGKAIKNSLKNLGFKNIKKIRQGKIFDIEINELNKLKIKDQLKTMSEKILTNLIIEDYEIKILD